jgi:hypothetical protein
MPSHGDTKESVMRQDLTPMVQVQQNYGLLGSNAAPQ